MAEPITVAVRLRPEGRYGEDLPAVTADAERKVVQVHRLSYPFDTIYDGTATNADVFDAAQRSVDGLLDGYNAAIFTWGIAGSGKSHTMFGNDLDPGVCPRAVTRTFKRLRPLLSEYVRALVKVSVVTLRQEKAFDQLAQREISVSEDVHPLESVAYQEVTSAEQVLSLVDNFRQSEDSAAHVVITLSLETTRRDANGEETRLGRMSFFDLARVEPVPQPGNAVSSMQTLVQVVNALTTHQKNVPYGASPLTSLMQDALGGNCRTCMLTTIVSSAQHLVFTAATLRFARSVAKIVNHPKVNTGSSGAKLPRYRDEISALKAQYQEYSSRSSPRAQQFRLDILRKLSLLEQHGPSSPASELSPSILEGAPRANVEELWGQLRRGNGPAASPESNRDASASEASPVKMHDGLSRDGLSRESSPLKLEVPPNARGTDLETASLFATGNSLNISKSESGEEPPDLRPQPAGQPNGQLAGAAGRSSGAGLGAGLVGAGLATELALVRQERDAALQLLRELLPAVPGLSADVVGRLAALGIQAPASNAVDWVSRSPVALSALSASPLSQPARSGSETPPRVRNAMRLGSTPPARGKPQQAVFPRPAPQPPLVGYSGGASVAVAPGASTAVAPGASVPVVPGASLAVAPATRTEPPRPKDDARPLLTTSEAHGPRPTGARPSEIQAPRGGGPRTSARSMASVDEVMSKPPQRSQSAPRRTSAMRDVSPLRVAMSPSPMRFTGSPMVRTPLTRDPYGRAVSPAPFVRAVSPQPQSAGRYPSPMPRNPVPMPAVGAVAPFPPRWF